MPKKKAKAVPQEKPEAVPGERRRRKWRMELMRELGAEKTDITRSQKMLVRAAVCQMSFLEDIDNQLARLPSVLNEKSGRVRGLMKDRIRAAAELRESLRCLGLIKRKGAKKAVAPADGVPELSELLLSAIESPNAAKASHAARRTQPEPGEDSLEAENGAARAESAAGIMPAGAVPEVDAQVFNRAHGLRELDELDSKVHDAEADALERWGE